MKNMTATDVNNVADAPSESFEDLVNRAAKVANVSAVFGEAREDGEDARRRRAATETRRRG